MKKITIDIPIIVEGKYDVIKLNSIIDGQIIKTDGFGLFKSEETQNYIRQLAHKKGVIVLTDSDGAGLVIRNHLNSILPKEKIIHLYPPQIEGKEKRKNTPSKEGFLGVEGISADTLRQLFTPFESNIQKDKSKQVSKLDFFEDGLTGSPNSADKRNALKKTLGLPQNISTNALLDTINLLYSYEEYKAFLKESEN
jgi:ribonuclease M5